MSGGGVASGTRTRSFRSGRYPARAPGEGFADDVLSAYRRQLAEITHDELEHQVHRTGWGELMSVENLLEHAVVHPMRHRRQLERILEGSD